MRGKTIDADGRHRRRARPRAANAAQPGKPAVIADVWDNPGGGVAGDGTLILRRIIDRGMDQGRRRDDLGSDRRHLLPRGGRGRGIELRFGGKSGPDGGEPVDARVRSAGPSRKAGRASGSRVTLGPSPSCGSTGTEIDVILNTNRTQTFEPDIFSNLGIDPQRKDLLLVKSTNHFYAGFAPIAAEIIYVAAGAAYPNNPRETNYRKLTRKIWPRVEDPFTQ